MDKHCERLDEDDPNFTENVEINFTEHSRVERMEALSLLLMELG